MAAAFKIENKRMYLWGALIVGGLLVLLLRNIPGGVTPEPEEGVLLESQPALQQVSALVQAKALAQKEKLKQPWGRSPFVAREAVSGALAADSGIDDFGSFSLTGIFSRQGRRIAIINHLLVREGDKVGETEVLRIEARQVVLKKGNDVMVLKLEGV